ncbi:MAG: hypothetical protein AAGI52_12565 [Bacteroidota bacterium]
MRSVLSLFLVGWALVGFSGCAPALPTADPDHQAAEVATVRVVYEQFMTGEVLPLQGVPAATQSASGARRTQTDGTGTVRVPCEAGEHVRVSVSTAGEGPVRVHTDPAAWLPFNERSGAGATEVACGETVTLNADRTLANVLVAMREIASFYEAEFGRTRGPVDVYVNPGRGVGLYSLWNNISFGEDGLDSPRGLGIMAHEYAHAFHHRALGGMPRGRCGMSHSYAGADDFGCAYTEGFAHFAATVALAELLPAVYGRPPESSGHYLRVVLNSGYPGDPSRSDRPDLADDGSVIEGPFAAFLWDLYDGPNTAGERDESAFDQTNYPLRYIGDVMATCQWVVAGRYRDEDGTDRLISCFQNRRVPYSETFFRLRYRAGERAWNYRPQEGATEPPDWNPDAITALWRRSLYGL